MGCDEGVQWFVLKDQGSISKKQLGILRAALGQSGTLDLGESVVSAAGNARPVQPLNGRKVYFDNADVAEPYYTNVNGETASVDLDKKNAEATLRKARKEMALAKKEEANAHAAEMQAHIDASKYKKMRGIHEVDEGKKKIAVKAAIQKASKAVKAEVSQTKRQDSRIAAKKLAQQKRLEANAIKNLKKRDAKKVAKRKEKDTKTVAKQKRKDSGRLAKQK